MPMRLGPSHSLAVPAGCRKFTPAASRQPPTAGRQPPAPAGSVMDQMGSETRAGHDRGTPPTPSDPGSGDRELLYFDRVMSRTTNHLALGLGLLAVGAALVRLLAPRRLSGLAGVRDRRRGRAPARLFGLREMASGSALQGRCRQAPALHRPSWSGSPRSRSSTLKLRADRRAVRSARRFPGRRSPSMSAGTHSFAGDRSPALGRPVTARSASRGSGGMGAELAVEIS